jgi:predicted MFS family arabinose efflux permease
MNFFMITAWLSTYMYFAECLNKAKGMAGTMVSYMIFVFGILAFLTIGWRSLLERRTVSVIGD